MLRFYLALITHLHYAFIYFRDLKKAIRENYSDEERFKLAWRISEKIRDKSRVDIITSGKENIPKDGRFILYPNHQGRYDAMSIINTCPRLCGFVIDDKRSHDLVESDYLDMIYSKRLKKDNLRQCLKTFNEILEDKEHNYCIFPEGLHNGNKNEMNEFFTGCFHFVFKDKSPLIPVCLYDTWKVYNHYNFWSRVKCQVHYLKPITYDEYKDLSRDELKDLIKSRIQAKLDELKKEEKD